MASIEGPKGGPYRVRYRTPEGQSRSQSFKKKRDAEQFAATVEADKGRGVWRDPRAGRTLFSDVARQTFAARLNLRPATVARDESYLRNHVLTTFGATPIARIEKKHVQEWVRTLSEDKGLAPRTVRECYRILGGVMREAVDDRLIPESPCRRVGLPRIEHTERKFLAPEQVETLAHAMDARYSTLVYVGAYGGLRWGELAGLRRQHLDLLRKRVNIVGSLERVGGGFRYVEETKTTSGRRMIPLPAFLVDALAAHLAAAPVSEYVFCSPQGRLLNYHTWRRRFWAPAVERAGLAPLTPHELRHTAAAIMIDQGADPVTVQRRLGHKDIRTTLQLYGHRFPEQDDLLTARLDALYARHSVSDPCQDDDGGTVTELGHSL